MTALADEQLTLDLSPIETPTYTPEMSLADRFAAFHAANPHVADALEVLARQWFAAGNGRTSIKALMERLRWESGIRTSGDEYRLNNSWTAFYARLLIDRNPEWSDRIATRHQRSAA